MKKQEKYKKLNKEQSWSEDDPFSLGRYKQFYRHFPANVSTVFDVGCNVGRGGRVIKELDPKVCLIGLDCLQERLDKIEQGIYHKLICAYLPNIELENSSVDVVVAGEVIEHLYPKDAHLSLIEFYRILKNKGRLLLTTPNPRGIRRNFMSKIIGRFLLGGAHVAAHYPERLKKELEEIGFRDIKIFGSGKASRFLGENFPFLNLYGSYLISANKE